jgi:predicted transcriptional regulator
VRKVADVMTREVIVATPDTPLRDIAALLEKNGIKRVSLVRNESWLGSSAVRIWFKRWLARGRRSK